MQRVWLLFASIALLSVLVVPAVSLQPYSDDTARRLIWYVIPPSQHYTTPQHCTAQHLSPLYQIKVCLSSVCSATYGQKVGLWQSGVQRTDIRV